MHALCTAESFLVIAAAFCSRTPVGTTAPLPTRVLERTLLTLEPSAWMALAIGDVR